MASAAPEVNVKGEAVERVFGNFVDRRYVVDRRYQRKLIWTIEEKQNFIDSIIRGFPVPIVLLAEGPQQGSSVLEIIDGMQRLDALVSFINNKYPVNGYFFDLNTIAVTKDLFDRGEILQKEPVMDRSTCVRIASYPLPLSIFEFTDDNAVDTVFRRINSGGRQLSRQELRAAGSTSAFATIIRRIAAKIRGDDSASDVLLLNEMQSISITNKELDYGIDIEEIFWIKQGVLSRDNVRQSRDEELVADLVAYMVSDSPVPSRTEHLDDYFGLSDDVAGRERAEEIEKAVKKRGADLVAIDFQRVIDEIRLTLEASGQTFVQLIFAKPQSPSPRYFQLVFLAFHQLLIRENLGVDDRVKLIDCLRGIGDHVEVQEGGRWGADNREKNVDSAAGVMRKAFGAVGSTDPAKIHWITQFENLLRQSYTEQAAYDFKQGFTLLDGLSSFDEKCFTKIMETCAAIANIGKKHKGYVVVGVAENTMTAARVEEIYGIAPRAFDRFFVTGVEHEARSLGKNLDQFFQMIADKVESSSLSEPLRSFIKNHLKSVRYYDYTIFVFEIEGQADPSLFDGKYYERCGAQVKEVLPADFPALFSRYSNS